MLSRLPMLAWSLRRHPLTLFWEGEYQMRKLCVLAAASLLFLGLSGIAAAAPIQVTYGLAPGGAATYTPTTIPGTPGTGPAGGTLTIIYTGGSTAIGGSLGTVGTMQGLQMGLAVPATILGGAVTIPGMGVGFGAVGTRTPGGVGAFGGSTYLPAYVLSPAQPAISGVIGALGFNPLGSATILVSGFGTQLVGVGFSWTITGVVGQEISRTVIPEPGTGVLLLGSLAGLAFGVRRLRR